MKKFKFLEHKADIKFQSYGKTIEESFENAARAMFKVMFEGKIKKIKVKKISVKGKDKEALLYNFLEELLFLLDSENFFMSDVKVKISEKDKEYELEGDVKGDDAGKYSIGLDVKAVTYNSMFVNKEKLEGKDAWICQVVIDV